MKFIRTMWAWVFAVLGLVIILFPVLTVVKVLRWLAEGLSWIAEKLHDGCHKLALFRVKYAPFDSDLVDSETMPSWADNDL